MKISNQIILKTAGILIIGLFMFSVNVFSQKQQPVQPKGYTCYGKLANGVPNAQKLGWKVGIQAYTFHKFTFFEAIDMTAALGLNYIEGVAGMPLCPGSDVKFGHGMPQEWKDKLKQKLQEAGIENVSYFQWMNGSGDEFEDIAKFAKEMNLMIVTDPKRVPVGGKSPEFYDEICKKYGVTLVFTNHRKPIAYWNPEFALEDTKGRSKYIGASVDIGHYMRDEFDPLPIVKKFVEAGRMYHFHMRDVSERTKDGYDVPLGEGQGKIREIFQVLYDNDVKPIIMMEYEKDFYNHMLELIPSVNYINKVCGEMLGESN
ncbi:sugar phosphate isomerase/epimerase [Bacteroides sp. 51]|uniref:sugar phosphate isomerase/epimerase family protein n=1 Tax=Bacteroides sp. 51 TaxID=2302938 RepID=UPI0013CFAD40|nr:sugar phosphate isomerase/epimerase [Bacteroides sp. 51]NDV81597.1 sugar phosphate isomerase/epimerase [Bacteroides sp. 51]